MTGRRSAATTVVVITHNYARYLPTAVASAIEQTVEPRVLLMDDGSTDETVEVVRALSERYPQLICRRSETARGLAATRNDAARRVDTEWVVYLDADDWLDSRFVERGERRLRERRTCDVLTTDMTVLRDGQPPVVVATRVPQSWWHLARKNVVFQTSFIRRSMILDLSGYDPAFAYEDWEFWIRVLKAGYTIDRLPGPHVFRREHGANFGARADRREATRAVQLRHPGPSIHERIQAWWGPRSSR